MISSKSSRIILTLDNHELWPSIIVLQRILFSLSFENLINVQQYLPGLYIKIFSLNFFDRIILYCYHVICNRNK